MPARFARYSFLAAAALVMAAACPLPARAGDAPATAPTATQAFYDHITPSLVAVKYTYVGETIQKDLIIPGIVVDDQGLVMVPLAGVSEQIPDEQMQKFKIIIPRMDIDNDELDAEFQGRDERCNMAFVRAKVSDTDKTKRIWTPIHFQSIPVQVGDAVSSIGLMPKSAGYHSIYAPSTVSANLRGPVKQVRVAGSLASPQAPVFNSDGTAIGIALFEPPAELDLDDDVSNQQENFLRMFAASASNHYFIPVTEFLIGLQNPPSAGHPVPLPWAGFVELSGLKKEDAELFNLGSQPAIQINDIIADSPAERAGLKKKDIIIKYEGQPLERGDQPDELPLILSHKLVQHKPGDVVTFSILSDKDQPPHDVKVTLEPQPKRDNEAQRYWSEEIGFGVREMVMLDRYRLKLKKSDPPGVLVTVLKEGGSAGTAGLHPYDMVTQVNGQAVTDLATFKSAYEDFRKDHEHEAIVLEVHRGAGDETIRIEPPQ